MCGAPLRIRHAHSGSTDRWWESSWWFPFETVCTHAGGRGGLTARGVTLPFRTAPPSPGTPEPPGGT